MPSNKLAQIAKEIAKKDRAFFDSLLEFERTKRVRTKARVTYTIDKALAARFKRFCREHGYNMSAKIEGAMQAIMCSGNAQPPRRASRNARSSSHVAEPSQVPSNKSIRHARQHTALPGFMPGRGA